MALERPVWTLCFFIIWGAIFVASVLMHVAVATIVPSISALPQNLADGLLLEFGIGTMASESESIMVSANTALRMCEPSIEESGSDGHNSDQEQWCLVQSPRCTSQEGLLDAKTQVYWQTHVETSEYVSKILDSYTASLKKVVTLADDKYLGVDQFQEAAAFSKEIKTKVEELKDVADKECCAQIPLYCGLYDLGKEVNGLSEEAQEGASKISDNQGVQLFEQYSAYLNGFHALPYIVVICMMFYSVLWYKNGNWCCCSNGKFIDFCCIILPQIVFWLFAFVVMAIFTAIGYSISLVFAVTTIEDLPGTPTIQELVDHISQTYTDFWDLCFTDLIGGMEFFRIATTIFFLVAWLIFFHSCCFCCCKPYASADGDAKAQG
jgi:hypothetical protein